MQSQYCRFYEGFEICKIWVDQPGSARSWLWWNKPLAQMARILENCSLIFCVAYKQKHCKSRCATSSCKTEILKWTVFTSKLSPSDMRYQLHPLAHLYWKVSGIKTQTILSALIQELAWRRFGAKTFLESVLTTNHIAHITFNHSTGKYSLQFEPKSTALVAMPCTIFIVLMVTTRAVHIQLRQVPGECCYYC